MLFIVATSEPRHSFAVASKNTELRRQTLRSTATDLCATQEKSVSAAPRGKDEHNEPFTRRSNGTKVQSAVRSKIAIRAIALELIASARLGHATSTASFAATGTPSANGGTWHILTMQGNLGLRL